MKGTFRPVVKFFLAFCLLYSILIGLSLVPAIGSSFNQIHQKVTEPLLQAMLPKAVLQLTPHEEGPTFTWVQYASKADVQRQMAEASRSGKKMMDVSGDRTPFNFYHIFLTFWLLFLALMLLSPLSWKAKLFRIFIGSLVFYCYSLFKLYMQLLVVFNKPEIGIYQISESSERAINSTLSVMTLGINLLLVLVLWVVLSFDKNNWKAFLEKVTLFDFPNKK